MKAPRPAGGKEDRAAEPEFTWAPGGSPPPVLWEHSARPLWAQVLPGSDAVLLSEKGRLLVKRLPTGETAWEQPAAEPPEELAVDRAGIALAAEQEVRSLDPHSGAERWRRKLGGDVGTLELDRGTVYAVSAQRSRGHLFALDRAEGRIRWRAPCGAGPEVHPLESWGLVLLNDPDTDALRAFEAAGGAQQWEFAAEGEPLVAGPQAGEVLPVSAHGYGAVALELSTGAARWRLESPRGFETAPALLEGALFLTDGTLHAVEAASGRVLWRREPADEEDGIFSVTALEGLLLAETWRGRLLALEPGEGRLLWERRLGQVQGVADGGERLYLRVSVERPAMPWGILALDRKTGEIAWELQVRRMPPDLTVAGGILLVELKNQVLALALGEGGP